MEMDAGNHDVSSGRCAYMVIVVEEQDDLEVPPRMPVRFDVAAASRRIAMSFRGPSSIPKI